MPRYTNKKDRRMRRHQRLRRKIAGTAECPRLAVCFTGKHIYAQFIDDEAGQTLASVSTLDAEFREAHVGGANLAAAELLGQLAAGRAQKVKIKSVTFDRGGFRYHGRVKAFADKARENGLEF